MEFPDLGKQCTFDGCSQLGAFSAVHLLSLQKDILEHFKLDDHLCPSRQDPSLDVRVPTCPLCEKPIPGPRNEDPNIRVNRHIQRNCKDEEKPTNVCRLKGCKAKLLVPMNCGACGLAYCVKHRLEQDHECQGRKATTTQQQGSGQHKLSALAAMKRAAGSKQQNNQDNRRNQSSTPAANRQKIQQLQSKANRTALTEQEQIQLATLMSLEQKSKDSKNCVTQ